MKLREQLISAATAANDAKAIARAKKVYDKICADAIKQAEFGRYQMDLMNKDYPELYSSFSVEREVVTRTIEILEDKFKEDGLELLYRESSDTFGEGNYVLKWEKK